MRYATPPRSTESNPWDTMIVSFATPSTPRTVQPFMIVLFAVPPDWIMSTVLSLVVPLMTVSLATPPSSTAKNPLVLTVVKFATPPTSMKPSPLTVTWSTVHPETISCP